jgi:hypothetical protein
MLQASDFFDEKWLLPAGKMSHTGYGRKMVQGVRM